MAHAHPRGCHHARAPLLCRSLLHIARIPWRLAVLLLWCLLLLMLLLLLLLLLPGGCCAHVWCLGLQQHVCYLQGHTTVDNADTN
jgi:hypothetical protein